MSPGLPLLLAGVALAGSAALGPRYSRLWLGLVLAGAAGGLAAALAVLGGAPDWEWRGGFRFGGEPVHLRLDGLAAWFLALVSFVGATGAVYSRGYWTDARHPVSAPRGRGWWSGLLLSLGWVLVSSNGLHFLLGWELFTVCAYFLVTLERDRKEVRAAGWLYLAASHAGTVFLFAFFAALAGRTGSWDLGPMRGHPETAPLFWLALAGFGVKAGMFPLHVWLPSAHANAPSHVSAILSGVAIKMGIYGLVRFSGWMPLPDGAGWVVAGLGATSALCGIAFALVQNDLKRLLAYCSVENIGIILSGLGLAMLGAGQHDAPWGRLALAGALLHVWNHGAFKSLLFLAAGSVLHATGTREMTRLGGLWRAMPWTAGVFAFGALAASGLPPSNGLVGEWLVYLGLLDAASGRGTAAWAAMPVAIVLATAGALALAAFVKAGGVVFLGAARTSAADHAHECGPAMRAPMAATVALCLAIGLAPLAFWPALARAVDAWRPGWTDAAVPAPLGRLGAFHAALAAVGALAGTALWRKARANGLRRAPTWDCGYAAPTARMQYTGGSFAGIAAEWFGWLLRPEWHARRPRGVAPTGAHRTERFPETILERAIHPVAEMVMVVVQAARRLQHGRLQSYIMYLAVGLVALGAIVMLGGNP